MVSCRYVGSDESAVGDREFTRVGEVAVFSEAVFKDAILGGAPFIPERNFTNIGMTQSELDRWGSPDNREDATGDFNEKLARAQQAFRDIRSGLSSPCADQILAEVSE